MTTSSPKHATTASRPHAPNHHAEYPAFKGPSGLFAGLSMLAGRGTATRLAIELASVTDGDRVVDIGCGPGAAARAAARRGARVIGVDPAPVMLALARRATRRTIPVTWKLGNAESLPIADAAATVVWAIATVHHWRDLELGLAEVRRVLAPLGRLVVLERRVADGTAGHASHGWTDSRADAFGAICRTAGFADVEVANRQTGKSSLLAVTARGAA